MKHLCRTADRVSVCEFLQQVSNLVKREKKNIFEKKNKHFVSLSPLSGQYINVNAEGEWGTGVRDWPRWRERDVFLSIPSSIPPSPSCVKELIYWPNRLGGFGSRCTVMKNTLQIGFHKRQ